MAFQRKYLLTSLIVPLTDLILSARTDFKNARGQQRQANKLSIRKKLQKLMAFPIPGPSPWKVQISCNTKKKKKQFLSHRKHGVSVRLEVLMALAMKNIGFWDVIPCSRVHI
jgi:hypothetical protein